MEPQVEIIFCDGFQNPDASAPNRPPSISTPFTSLKPYAIPGNYSFAVYCTIEGLPNPPLCTKISLEIGEENGNIFLPRTPLPVNAINTSGEYASVNMGIDLRNMVISKEGDVYVRIWMEEEIIGEKKIKVFQMRSRQ